jgi:golgi phosphoprotein 3
MLKEREKPMFTLTEELFLLSLRDGKNSVTFPHSTTLSYALAGAMLVELVLRGRIRLEESKWVILQDDLPVEDDERLKEVLAMIRAATKPRKITHWINQVGAKGGELEKKFLAVLVGRNVLKEEKKKFLWVIPFTEYSQQDASAKYLRKQQLRDIVLGGKNSDVQSVVLLSLMKSVDLLDQIFTVDEMKAARVRVSEIVKDEAIGSAVTETLDAIFAAALEASMSATFMA